MYTCGNYVDAIAKNLLTIAAKVDKHALYEEVVGSIEMGSNGGASLFRSARIGGLRAEKNVAKLHAGDIETPPEGAKLLLVDGRILGVSGTKRRAMTIRASLSPEFVLSLISHAPTLPRMLSRSNDPSTPSTMEVNWRLYPICAPPMTPLLPQLPL